MTDTLGHILLGLVLFASVFAAFLFIGPVMAAGVVAAWDIYFREVTQQQGKHFDNDFRRGWLPWKWSIEKNIETWIPVAVVISVAVCVQIIF